MRKRFNEANDSDVILNSMFELTHGFGGEGESVPTFFNIEEITNNYGLSEKEVIDIAKANGYNVYRIPGGEDLVNFTVIAHEDLSYGDIVKGTEVNIKDIGDDTDDSFNAEESYMNRVDTNDLYRKLKDDTNNFTASDTLSFNSFEEQIEARKILLKHYDSVETFANNYGNHQVYFIDIDEPKKNKVKESALDDLKVSSYKYLLDVYDRDDNFIERKFFRSRPEADKFVDAMSDLFDIKISNNEVVELKNGKDFFGTYWKVIRDLKKEESLNESNEEVVEETNEYKIVKTIQHNFKTVKGVARKSKDKVIYQVYFRTQDFNSATNRWMNKGWTNSTSEHDSIESARAYVKKYGKTLKDELEEDKEQEEVYRGYKIVYHPKYSLWANMKEYYRIFSPKGTLVGGQKTIDGAKAMIDKRIQNKQDMFEEVEDELKPWYLQQGENGEPEYLGFAKSQDDMIDKMVKSHDSNSIYENTYIEELDKDTYLYMKKEGTIDEDDLKELDRYFGIEEDTNEMSFEEFLKNADVLIVDDAKSFDINEWEKETQHEIDEELDEESSSETAQSKFIKYKLDDTKLKEVVDKLSKSDFSVVDGRTSWKTKQFLKKKNLTFDDLKEVLRSLQVDDYKTNSKPAGENAGYNEAIIFVKNTKVKDLGPFSLYIKLDYDSVEEEPVIVISLHQSQSNDKQVNSSLEEDIEKHEELNPKLFDGDELKPEVKDKIVKIADEFVKELNEDNIHFVLKDIVLLGSNVSYNYTKDSDLDIHLIADSSGFECPQELYDKLYGAYRSIFNKNYDIKLKGIPAEIYVELDEPRAKSNGIYSINNGWIKHPEQQAIPNIDREAFDELFTEWEDRYFDLIGGIKNED